MVKIIGAGPAGNYAAFLLARKGYDVEVFEEHKAIGKPVQCTGIISHALDSIIKVKKEFLVNTIKNVKINSVNGCLDLKLKNKDYIIDRTNFDSYLAMLASDEGVKFRLGKKFKGCSKTKMKIGNKVMPYNKLIGADGPNSLVARSSRMYGKRKFVAGVQARIKDKFDPECFETWLGLGEFAWLVPESENTARVGVIAKNNSSKYLKKLLMHKFTKSKILGFQGGLVPLHNPWQRIQRNNNYLLGDAATQVKATTYGGIVYGLMAAEELTKSFKHYELNCTKRFGKELYTSLKIRNIMNNFSLRDYDKLIRMFSDEKLKTILQTHDRDFPVQMLTKILLNKPSVVKFAKNLV